MAIFSTLTIFTKSLFSICAGIFGIGFLIGLHELGHLLFCKLFNISAPSFSIGFGPRIWKKKIGETEYSISAIPLGGYVEIAGSEEVGQGEQKEAKRNDERSLKSKPYWQKMLVMFGGIILNILFSYIVLISLYMVGIPKTPLLYPQNATNIVKTIKDQTPAARSGIKPNDIILSINNHSIIDHTDLMKALEPLANQKARLILERNGQEIKKCIFLDSTKKNGKDVGMLGVTFNLRNLPPQTLGRAIVNGIRTTNTMISNVFQAIKSLFIKRSVQDIGGPLMILSATTSTAKKGIKLFLLLLAFISANLAVLNILPLPILDGGQALFYTVEALAGKELPEKIKLLIHYICWIAFMILILYLTYKDIIRIALSLLK